MALADAPRPYGRTAWFRTRTGGLRLTLGPVPPPALILLSILSVQAGFGLAKNDFTQASPATILILRMLTLAGILGISHRTTLRDVRRLHSWRDIGVAALFGLSLAGMSFFFFQALARL